MKLEFWIDYNNPMCYKQHQVIESIVKKYKREDFELLYRSYEMIPFFEPSSEHTFYELMSRHYVSTLEETIKMYPNIPDHFYPVKVIDAHRLSHLAKKYDVAFEYHKALFHAYYEQQKDISNHDVLVEIGTKIGIEEDLIRAVLQSNLYLDSVQSNRENAIVKGIFELPHMRINGKLKLACLHDEKTIIDHIIQAEQLISRHEHCDDGNCERKKTR